MPSIKKQSLCHCRNKKQTNQLDSFLSLFILGKKFLCEKASSNTIEKLFIIIKVNHQIISICWGRLIIFTSLFHKAQHDVTKQKEDSQNKKRISHRVCDCTNKTKDEGS